MLPTRVCLSTSSPFNIFNFHFSQCSHDSHHFQVINIGPSCRLLGVDKLFSYAINEWLNDIKKNQLPGILGGVGPIHSLVQLGKLESCFYPAASDSKNLRVLYYVQFTSPAFHFGTLRL